MFTVCNVIVHTWEHRNTDAKKHTNRYMIHACGNTEKHTCSDKAGSLAVQWIVVTMALVTDDAATVHKDSESGADLWLLRYNIKTIPSGSDTATSKHGHSYETRHISHLLLPDGEVRGASCPKLFVLLLIFWAKNMPDLAIKRWFINTQHTQICKNNHNSFLFKISLLLGAIVLIGMKYEL